MAHTVVGLFENSRDAQQAVVQLVDNGIPRDDIGVTSRDYMNTGSPDNDDYSKDEGFGEKISNFFSSLFGSDNSEDASYYSDAVNRGNVVVTVDADSADDAQRAVQIMNRLGADIEGGATPNRNNVANINDTKTTQRTNTGKATIPVIEEDIDVGKRQVEGGGVRVQSRIIEKPVEEHVRLREERVNVERHPVNRPVTDADIRAFREGTFEVRERSEQPVVNKKARVVEEVAINKDVNMRDHTVKDTVRRTDVDVQKTNDNVKTRTARAGSTYERDDRDDDIKR
jgi:stress response protein YsnF